MQLIFLIHYIIPGNTFIEIISQLFSIIETEFIVLHYGYKFSM